MRKSGLLLGAALILVTNAFVLVGVARNRAGEPVETIQLTQRELPTGFRQKEDTGVSLRLSWNRGFLDTGGPVWLDRPKLESLGFDCAAALRDTKHIPLPRSAFIVFEYDGPAWEALRQREQQLPFYKGTNFDGQSRLIPIDAAKTPDSLFQKYADRKKYLIVRGIVRAFVSPVDPNITPIVYHILGTVSEILPQEIHVPPSLANAFAATPYTVTLAYGHRFEPWVVTK